MTLNLRPSLTLLALGVASCGAGQAADLNWTQREGWREAALTVPANGRSGFTLLRPDESGLRFTNQLSYAKSEANQNLLNGCGVAAGDFDGDGRCDLYFAGCDGPNGLYRNTGNWKFENVTDAAGVGAPNQSTKGVVFADVTGDGLLDIFAAALGGPNALFVNLGNGRFTNATTSAGLTARAGAGAHSAALADVDGDGDLDLYVANYGELSILRNGGLVSVRKVNGKDVITGRWAKRVKIVDGVMLELGDPDGLYLNDGRGNFSIASWTDGRFLNADGSPLKSDPADMGLSVMFRDIDGDGSPDIYVCNDFQTPDRIWINDGKGRFRALPDLAMRVMPHFSMGIDFADIDRDGHDDFFVGDMFSRRHKLRLTQMGATNPNAARVGETMDRQQIRRNVLAWNRGDGTYADIAEFSGVAASDWTWAVAFLDVDLDGYEDLLTVNAHAYDTQDLDQTEKSPGVAGMGQNRQIGKSLKDFPPLITPNYLFRNRGNRTFEETGAQWGFNSTNISHGIALADFDNDGDLDVAVSCLWQPPLLYRNESGAPRVAVRLRGLAQNAKGIGAKVKLLGGAVPMQRQEMQCGGRYLSADDTMRVFAAGAAKEGMTLEVTWRSGRRSVVPGVKVNHLYEIDEAAAVAAPPAAMPPELPGLFRDTSSLLVHTNEPMPIDDLDRQPMIVRSLLRPGPGVAWSDLDGDGHDELIIGSGPGKAPIVFKADGRGQFSRLATDIARAAGLDATAGRAIRDGGLRADMDGDGDLDEFDGGGVASNRYPEAVAPMLLRNDAGRLSPDAARSEPLKKAGLVRSSVFSDLDGDGLPELILACEWGPVRVFRNERGRFNEATKELGLSEQSGWWTSVTTGDVDGDGRLDIIAGNWGLNHSYAVPWRMPAHLFHGDFDGAVSLVLVEAETDPETGLTVPKRDLAFLSRGWPSLRLRFTTHAAFSTADISAVLGNKFGTAGHLQANTFASMVFLNRTNRFEAVPLPDEAQWSPVFGLNVADFDGDGHEDLFLAQNFFANRPEEPRADAGRGLVLRGDGTGRFTPMRGQESGVKIYGEQRGSATADYDGDGRVDLLVAQAGGETKLFHNESAKPGLRVRLRGAAGNPHAIGAVVRLACGAKPGPAREIHGGSGYRSLDSATIVLATPKTPTQVTIRWPGGRSTTSDIPAGAREIRVEESGKVEPLR